MSDALIGHTGFVGGGLLRQRRFDQTFNRANLDALPGRSFGLVVCAGLPAAKWIANREPAADLANVERLCRALEGVRAERFVLVSTVDVYPRPEGCDEGDDPGATPNHAYGANRLRFERFVRERFPGACVLRLPALFGHGLRKNVLYDLLHRNQLEAIDPAARFQWYPTARLPADIDRALAARLDLVNLVTEPIATSTIVARWFADRVVGAPRDPSARYDLGTRHAAVFGGLGRYIADAAAVLEALDAWLREERASA